MDSKSKSFVIRYSRRAERDLDVIWDHNAEEYGVDHADAYRSFLVGEIDRLRTGSIIGSAVGNSAGDRYLVLTYREAKYSHLAVYSVDHEGGTVTILRLFHSAQDWKR